MFVSALIETYHCRLKGRQHELLIYLTFWCLPGRTCSEAKNKVWCIIIPLAWYKDPILTSKRKTNVKWKKEWASSHTPRSNIAWECCIQWIAIPSISDGQSDKKGDINCSSKGSNQHFLYKCISTHNVLHNYKVSRNSVEQFQWSCADQLFQ